ncbi:MAG TPA: sodium:proton antiporter NhaD, partial [Pseudomonadales bacterium]|nr:sodium:proton antiporter NhaD [Pseudomonadales bacterium]
MKALVAIFGLLFSQAALAMSVELPEPMGLTDTGLGMLALAIFVGAYVLVAIEEFTDLRKSKPVLLAAGLIWIIVALLVRQHTSQDQEALEAMVQHNLAEYAALFLFLLVAMTYINAMTERNVFEALRAWLVNRAFNYRQLFWITGIIAFFVSPIADNMTTALLMGAVVLSVGKDNPKFVTLACVNIVIAANAGGAFSPFGDITTLMVWQSLHVTFFEFFALFLPSAVTYLVPALILNFSIPASEPKAEHYDVPLKRGAFTICILFVCTIITAVSFEQFLHLPPFLGMMTGMAYLFFYSHYIRMTSPEDHEDFAQFNIFNKVAQAEWDTLFFFFGVMFCVGGLGYIG